MRFEFGHGHAVRVSQLEQRLNVFRVLLRFGCEGCNLLVQRSDHLFPRFLHVCLQISDPALVAINLLAQRFKSIVVSFDCKFAIVNLI